MSRLKLLEARRRALLTRAAVQREELSLRLAQLREHPLSRAAGALFERPAAGRAGLAQPLAWALGIAGVLLLRRPRQLMSLLVLARSAAAAAARAAVLVRLIGDLRGKRRAPPAA